MNPCADQTIRLKVRSLTLAVVASVLLGSCSSSSDMPSGSSSASPSGPWTFIDDRHEAVEVESTPLRIVAQEDAAAALWHLGITPVGIIGGAPIDDNPQLEGVDVTNIESVGEVWGEINLEKLVALQPDLIVTTFYNPTPLWGFANEKQQKTAEAIAPIVALDANLPATQLIGRFEDLASSLGADMESPELVAARKRFDAAFEDLRQVVQDKKGLTVLALAGYPEELYIAVPDWYQDLQDYERMGMDIVVPDTADPYWETLSWEQADKYPADVLMYDARSYSLGPEKLAEFPTWTQLPAVKAGQIVPWRLGTSTSYQLFAEHIEELTVALKNADPSVV